MGLKVHHVIIIIVVVLLRSYIISLRRGSAAVDARVRPTAVIGAAVEYIILWNII